MPDALHPDALYPGTLHPSTLKEVLPCGLTLLLESDPQAHSVAAGYFVSTGARDEDAQDMGVSHFLEHLMFKGSHRLSAAQLNEKLDDLGGQANAFTSEEATVYHAASLPEHWPELLDTLTELLRPALRADDLESERRVILEEIAMYADQPSVRVMDALHAQYWGAHPLGHLILGTAQTVGRLTQGTLAAYHRAHYSAPQVTLAVVGQFPVQDTLAWARAHLADWPQATTEQGSGLGMVTSPPPPAVGQGQGVQVIHEASLARVQVALAAPGLPVHHPLREAAHVLADLIGGENGALYWALLDTGLADGADLSHLDYRDTGTFEGGFSCDPERAQSVLDTYRDVLRRAETLITAEGVRRAARKMAVSLLLRAETPQGRLFTLGLEHLHAAAPVSTDELVRRCMQVTPQQVREVLRLCPLSPLSVVALGPLDTLV